MLRFFMVQNIFLLAIAYLLGSISLSKLLTKAFKLEDPTATGSGNAGFSNVYRLNRKLGFITGLSDLLKGIFCSYLGSLTDYGFSYGATAGLIGNLLSIFRTSGKGMAMLMGVGSYLSAYNIALPILWFLFAKSYYASAASLFVVGYMLIWVFKIKAFILLLPLILIIYKHKDNIYRLWTGSELKLDR